ncbi:hypothetical protein ABN763_06640 [Spongiivirga sp. MCCC 1A20706]|uniref:hypothetical protein n=1 Tax=Spongiivirga sp. MCCC 1A20706 TaxID=3160963 RepID=UPI00397750FE
MNQKKDNKWQLFLILLMALAVVGLTVLSYFNHVESKQKLTFLENEKETFKKELNDMIKQNETLQNQNIAIAKELEDTKGQMVSLLDSLSSMGPNFSEIRRFRQQIRSLRAENRDLMVSRDSLQRVNQQLVNELRQRDQRLASEQKTNAALKRDNEELSGLIEKGSSMQIEDVASKAFWLRSAGQLSQTTLSEKTDVMETCFTILPNNLMQKGDKELFFQIVAPDGEVINPTFQTSVNNKKLWFSKKRVVNFTNKILKVCDSFNLSNAVMESGTYQIKVFFNDELVGATMLALQ